MNIKTLLMPKKKWPAVLASSIANYKDSTGEGGKNSISNRKKRTTLNEKLIANLLESWNSHCSIEENLRYFASDFVQVKFEDSTPDMPAGVWAMEHDKLNKSFPDIRFRFKSIKEDEPGQVLVDGLRVGGAHTGEPYGFSHFPPVPRTNKQVINDPERLWFTIEHGKITLMETISLGDMTGPEGFYRQVGGKLDAPRKAAPGNGESQTLSGDTELDSIMEAEEEPMVSNDSAKLAGVLKDISRSSQVVGSSQSLLASSSSTTTKTATIIYDC